MYHILITSLFIAIVLLVRGAFRRWLPPRLTYALWLLVLVRLCLPITLFEVPLPELPSFEQAQTTLGAFPAGAFPVDTVGAVSQPAADIFAAASTQPADTITTDVPVTANDSAPAPAKSQTKINWRTVGRTVWAVGSALIGAYFLLTWARFITKTRAGRRFLRYEGRTKVYVSGSIGSPCLAGLIPAIYITPAAEKSDALPMILLHERTHLRHLDPLWSTVRVIVCCALWWNPLIWAAARASARDAELACDDAVAAKLSDGDRRHYARTLVDMASAARETGTALSGSPLKERVQRLLDGRKTRVWAVALTAVLTLAALGCSFAGESALPDDHWYAEGLYLRAGNSHMILIDSTGPVVMRGDFDFSGLTDGDRIRVEVFLIEETYPGRAEIFGLEKLSDGSIADIDGETLASLAEMGWIDADTRTMAVYSWNQGYITSDTVPMGTAAVTLPFDAEAAGLAECNVVALIDGTSRDSVMQFCYNGYAAAFSLKPDKTLDGGITRYTPVIPEGMLAGMNEADRAAFENTREYIYAVPVDEHSLLYLRFRPDEGTEADFDGLAASVSAAVSWDIDGIAHQLAYSYADSMRSGMDAQQAIWYTQQNPDAEDASGAASFGFTRVEKLAFAAAYEGYRLYHYTPAWRSAGDAIFGYAGAWYTDKDGWFIYDAPQYLVVTDEAWPQLVGVFPCEFTPDGNRTQFYADLDRWLEER
ncbi:MAG: hypothetical protein IJ493_00470 [Clostridia bacterium]|nr:hypothetical protein [Clostridia bacterium]